MYPAEVDICNSGMDLGEGWALPRPELAARPELHEDSLAARMQSSGAAMYWACAATISKTLGGDGGQQIAGRDVLEVACGRGGGAVYLTRLLGPRRYVATDINAEQLAPWWRKVSAAAGGEAAGLVFDRAGAGELADRFAVGEFDVVLCVQSVEAFREPARFIKGAAHCLRDGGRLIICDQVTPGSLQELEDALAQNGLRLDAFHDLSDAVCRVGVCDVPDGRCFALLVASKQAPGNTA